MPVPTKFKGCEVSDTEVQFSWEHSPEVIDIFNVSFDDGNLNASYTKKDKVGGFILYYDSIVNTYGNNILVDKYNTTFKIKHDNSYSVYTGGTHTVDITSGKIYYFSLSEIDIFTSESSKTSEIVVPIRNRYFKYNEKLMKKGIEFPFNYTKLGNVNYDKDEEHLISDIKYFMCTNYKERVMRPRAGSNISNLIFKNISDSLFNVSAVLIRDTLSKDKRVSNVEVKIRKQEENMVVIFVNFIIIRTGREVKLVFVS